MKKATIYVILFNANPQGPVTHWKMVWKRRSRHSSAKRSKRTVSASWKAPSSASQSSCSPGTALMARGSRLTAHPAAINAPRVPSGRLRSSRPCALLRARVLREGGRRGLAGVRCAGRSPHALPHVGGRGAGGRGCRAARRVGGRGFGAERCGLWRLSDPSLPGARRRGRRPRRRRAAGAQVCEGERERRGAGLCAPSCERAAWPGGWLVGWFVSENTFSSSAV